jgi:rod shape-determining protein MreC
VINVSKNFATVQSVLHNQFRVVAKLKNSNETGTVSWDGEDPQFVTMKNIPKSVKVEKGDTVLTPQISSLFPANLMVGTVAEIIPDNTSNFYTLKLKTATNFSTIEYVYVIDNLQFDEQKKLEDSTRKKSQ